MAAGKLGELLVSQGLISKVQLDSAVDYKRKHNTRLGSALVQLGHVNENVYTTFLAKQYGLSAISLDNLEISQEVVSLVPRNLCEKHCLIPFAFENNRVSIAIFDPTNVGAIDDVRFLCNRDVDVFIAAESDIQSAIERAYKDNKAALEKIVKTDEEISSNTKAIEIGVEKEAVEVEQDRGDGDKPVIRLINTLFVEAVRKHVSDIHIEPAENFSRVRFRIDGALHEVMRIPANYRSSVPARIKVMAQLNISERRLPQDGRIQIRSKEHKIDVRVSTLPTILGEKVVMRLLDQGGSTPDLVSIGFEEEQLKLFRKAASQPYGMVLVTGPTGSGKSTTLYAILSELNDPDVNISTVEDPVEYRMAGVNQVQMKEGIGFNFATALRSLLRQDPDIIMVGEIRDQETAEIAIKSALTGHMVFSTLHTNDASSTITRLHHMGIEPFLITAALTLVQAQRLIRVLCTHCAETDPKVKPEDAIKAEMPESWLSSLKPRRGKGCDKCGKTGYKGRRGIFEVMYVTERLRELVVKGSNADMIKKIAIEEGMITLRQSALMKFYRGQTTLEEVLNNSRPDGDLLK